MAIDATADIIATLTPEKIAIIGAFGVGAQWIAWRLQMPAIVLLSLSGLILGPLSGAITGTPLLDPQTDFGPLYRPLIALAVALILFEGGLALEFKELRSARTAVRRLVIVGAPLGWVLGALAAHYVAGLPWPLAWLLGGVLVVTGPTVILPLLRQAKLSARPAAALKWEGIVNDPVGALLAVGVLEVILLASTGIGWPAAFGRLAFGSVVGGALGVVGGMALAKSFRSGQVPEYLKAPLVLAAVLVCFVIADSVVHETGLLAVTVLGITIANSRLASIEDMRRFKETIATVLVSGVFIILTASLQLSSLTTLDWRAGAFVLTVLFIVRPATIWTATIKSGLTWQERALVGWIAPRGVVAVAVSGFFAAELLNASPEALGLPASEIERIPTLTFAIVFATILAHGFTISPLARRLGLANNGPDGVLMVGASPWTLDLAKALEDVGVPVTIADTNWTRLRRARLDGLNTYYGEVLSENADHRLDHTSFKWVIAVSPNDAYNSLVCVEFAPELGRHRVYQLPSSDSADRERGIAFTTRGRTFLAIDRSFDALTRDWWRGWRFSATTLSETYTIDDFTNDRGNKGDFIAEIRSDQLSLFGPKTSPKGGPGVTILWFGPNTDHAAPPSTANQDLAQWDERANNMPHDITPQDEAPNPGQDKGPNTAGDHGEG